jgi:glycosyltransferase involved in cell wall biosynthesis
MTLLSICIPTFNRSQKVFELVKDILENCRNNEIEVLVLDNCSTDNTENLLKSVIDKRFRYYRNESQIIGPLNIIESLKYAKGKFAFLCLDKDFFSCINLDALIESLNLDKHLSFGYCELNIVEMGPDSLYGQGLESLFNMSYLSTHPTGMFYNSDFFKTIKFENFILDQDKIFGFYPDIINAEMSLLGTSKIIRLPLFFTERRDECEFTPSFTFKKEEDLFFTPGNRAKTFLIYVKHLFELDIPQSDKITVINRLFRDELIASTVVYKGILKDDSICKHYFTTPRDITYFELLRIDLFFVINFIMSDIPISWLSKTKIILTQHKKILYSVLRNKYKTFLLSKLKFNFILHLYFILITFY